MWERIRRWHAGSLTLVAHENAQVSVLQSTSLYLVMLLCECMEIWMSEKEEVTTMSSTTAASATKYVSSMHSAIVLLRLKPQIHGVGLLRRCGMRFDGVIQCLPNDLRAKQPELAQQWELHGEKH